MAVSLVTSGSLGPALAASSDFAHYYYFKQQRPLNLDPSQLAVFDPDSVSTAAAAGFLINAGYQQPALTPTPIPGWSLFRLAEASGTPELALTATSSGVDSIAATIARLVGLDTGHRFFFSPIFAGGFGPIIPTRTILVQFRHDLTPAQIAAVLERLGAASLSRTPLGNLTNAFTL
jgi:hypothetical protein